MPTDPLTPLLELPGVEAAVVASRMAVDGLLGHRVLRRRSNEVSAESALRGAWASSVLSGADISLADLRAGEIVDPVVQGALRVSAELGGMTSTWVSSPLQVLARLHVLAAADLGLEPARLGRPSAGAEVATASDVAGRLDLLAQTLAVTHAPAVLVAAVVAGEILSLEAFGPSSIVIAGACIRLTLVSRGLDPKSLVVVEVGALEMKASTEAALAGYRSGTPDGLAEWIAEIADWVVLGARESVAICEAIQRG